jgi:hypothetical protein
VQYPNLPLQNSVENLARITDERKHAHAWSLDHARRAFRVFRNMNDGVVNARFKRRRDRIPEQGAAVG